jgi:hypothetical protein
MANGKKMHARQQQMMSVAWDTLVIHEVFDDLSDRSDWVVARTNKTKPILALMKNPI